MEKQKQKSNKIFAVFSILTIVAFGIIFNISSTLQVDNKGTVIDRPNKKKQVRHGEANYIYAVYLDNKFLKDFETLDDAIIYSDIYDDSYVVEKGKSEILWKNEAKYSIYIGEKLMEKTHAFSDAVRWAKNYDNSYVYSYDEDVIVWSNKIKIEESVILNVPFIQQNPELIRGCEVTSLSMLLKYMGYSNADKMTLAEQIDKDTTPFSRDVDGKITFGNPSVGFLGSMSDINKPGYGANHKPIKKLLQRYIDGKAIDLTGLEFDDLYYYINKQAPIWVITNTDLKPLYESDFYTWNTPIGEIITATNKEHSVLITGYDSNYIYINDPLYTNPNRKVDKNDFIEAWEQMGNQAITYIP